MSRAAVEWAAKQFPPQPADKLVLWSLADATNKAGEAFPSVAAVSAFTGLERKRIMSSLARLQSGGWIADTGRRVGATKQVKVWRLAYLWRGRPDETVP
nr:helix-turn-helix domain-containing protein [Sphingomonas sp. Y57]